MSREEPYVEVIEGIHITNSDSANFLENAEFNKNGAINDQGRRVVPATIRHSGDEDYIAYNIITSEVYRPSNPIKIDSIIKEVKFNPAEGEVFTEIDGEIVLLGIEESGIVFSFENEEEE